MLYFSFISSTCLLLTHFKTKQSKLIMHKTKRNHCKCSKMFLNEDRIDARSRNRCTFTSYKKAAKNFHICSKTKLIPNLTFKSFVLKKLWLFKISSYIYLQYIYIFLSFVLLWWVFMGVCPPSPRPKSHKPCLHGTN